MANEKLSWDDYYKKIQRRAPRPLLLDALEKFPTGTSLHAIDLGCGDGTESMVLLSRGWNVLAVDGEPSMINRLMDKVPQEAQVRLQIQVAKFEEVILPSVDMNHASYSIPFCHPGHFPMLWTKITNAVKPGGRFASQFFGVRDSWANEPDMTFHTEEQVRAMLEKSETEYFHEQDVGGKRSQTLACVHGYSVEDVE